VAFNASFEAQQRLYYTLEAMGKVDELHGKVFQAIHKEGQQLNKEDTILSWAEKQGLDKARFKDLFNSFMVASKIKRASQLQEAYRVPGVPALGVAGRYFTDGDLTGNMERALQVVDFLIGEARKAR
jgi:thiol:disulfide interchange protein DsbA